MQDQILDRPASTDGRTLPFFLGELRKQVQQGVSFEGKEVNDQHWLQCAHLVLPFFSRETHGLRNELPFSTTYLQTIFRCIRPIFGKVLPEARRASLPLVMPVDLLQYLDHSFHLLASRGLTPGLLNLLYKPPFLGVRQLLEPLLCFWMLL